MAIKKNIIEKPAPIETAPVKTKSGRFYVYVGPAIRGVIGNNTVIKETELKGLDSAIAQYPDIKALLIPGDELGKTRPLVKQPGNYLHALYAKLAKSAR